jgi:NTP pyrophosphatase (non-canonical NTP hydrolase)
MVMDKPGYHIAEIPKGELGEISKIKEELAELEDAEAQGSKIMMQIELADLYGAVESYAQKHGWTMYDLAIFNKITKRAFKNGARQ